MLLRRFHTCVGRLPSPLHPDPPAPAFACCGVYQGITKKDVQPIVEVQLYGLPSDTNKKFRTRPCRGRGLSPRWNADNTVTFVHIILPDIASLRFNVIDNRDQSSLGWMVLPVPSVQPGYRYVPLQQTKGSGASIFCKLDINQFVPSEHSDFIDRIQNPTVRIHRYVGLLV